MNVDKFEIHESTINALPTLADYAGILSKRLDENDLENIVPILKRNFEIGTFNSNEMIHNVSEIFFDMLLYMYTNTNSTPNEFIAVVLYPCAKYGDIQIDEAVKCFGDDVAIMLKGFLNISNMYAEQNDMLSEYYFKLTLTFAEDIRVIYYNLIFRLMLMRQISGYKKSFQKRIMDETSEVYIAFAHKLGFTELKNELEDLCFKYYNPQAYFGLSEKLKNTEYLRDKYIEDFIRPIDEKLKKMKLVYTIKGRNKGMSSIHKKMVESNISFDQIYDLTAIRIIVDTPLDTEKPVCWQIYSLVAEIYKPSPDRLKDWISIPKSNGYESLHITVMGPQSHWVEVQIRTKRMDDVAEHGLASHWKYKGIQHQERFDELLSSLNEAFRNRSFSKDEIADKFHIDLFDNELFLFTSKGELHKMPYGSTVLDFAFFLDPELGYSCMSGRVNGKVVSIRHKLNNGDQIEIITSSKHRPKADWLKFAFTIKAKRLINQWLLDHELEKKQVGANQILEENSSGYGIRISDATMPIPEKLPSKPDLNHTFSLRIMGENESGILLKITESIFQIQNISIDSINIDFGKNNSIFYGDIVISVQNHEAFDEVINNLSNIKNIKEVEKL